MTRQSLSPMDQLRGVCGRPIDSLALVVSPEIAERTGSLNSKCQERASHVR